MFQSPGIPTRLVFFLVLIFFVLIFSACSPVTPQAIPRLEPTRATPQSSPSTQALTTVQASTAASQDSTSAPTLIPSPTQAPTATPEIKAGPQIIVPGDAAQVTALARLGKGTILSYPLDAPEGMPVYSPDGLWMAIPTSAGIYIYDAASLEELRMIPVGASFIFSPDGSILAAGGRGAVSLWDPAKGTQLGELPGEPDDHYSVLAFSPDGSLLAVESINREIVLWSLESHEKLFTVPGDRLGFSPDGELAVVVVYGENRVVLYQTRDGNEVNQWNVRNAGFAPGGQLWLEDDQSVRLVYIDRNLVTAPFGGVQPSFSADGSLVAFFAHDQVWLYDHQKGRRTQMLAGNYLRIDGVLFSPDGQTLAGDVYNLLCPTCSEMDGWQRSLVLWRAADGSIIKTIEHPTGWIGYSPDGKSLAALELESLEIINTVDGSILKRIDGFTNAVVGMALSADGQTLAAVHAAGEYSLCLWDLETGCVKRAPLGPVNFNLVDVQVSYSPDGKFIAVGGDLWDLAAGERLTAMEQAISSVTSCWSSGVAFSPKGDSLATGCFDGQLDLWRVPDGTLLKRLTGYKSWVNELAYSPDGERLAAIYNVPDYLVHVWQLSEGTPVFKLTGGHFTRVAFSADGHMLATVTANPQYDQYGWPAGYVQLWSAADGAELTRLALEDAVSIAFSPDGRILATGSFDGTLRLWEIAGGKLLMQAKNHYQSIQRLDFTPDGDSLVSGSQDGTILRWGIPSTP